MVVKNIKTEILAAFAFMRINVKAAAELRTAFALQILGMMLNNMSFLIIWLFFANAFGKVNGWGAAEIIMLDGLAALIFGIAFGFGAGSRSLPDVIHNGVFDNFLLNPRVLYIRIIVNRIEVSAFGDMLFGSILVIIASVLMQINILQFGLLLGLIIPAGLIMLNFGIITSLLAFIVTDASEISRNAFEIFFGPSLYPGGLFQGSLRFFFMFIIPSLFVGAFPVEVIRDSNIQGLILTWAIAILWTIIAVILLNKAVKHYESSNLIGARAV
jgi:ABC-2 type transport system permease protein